MASNTLYDEFNFAERAVGNRGNVQNLEQMLNTSGASVLASGHEVLSTFVAIYHLGLSAKIGRAEYEIIRPFFFALGTGYAKRFADEVNSFGLFGRAGKSTDGREDPRNFVHVCMDNEDGSIRHASIKRYIILLIEFYGHELHKVEQSMSLPAGKKHAKLVGKTSEKSGGKPTSPGTTTAGGVTTTPTRGGIDVLSVGKPPKPAGPTRNPAVPAPASPNPKSPTTFYVTPTPYVPANSKNGTQLTSPSAADAALLITDISDPRAAAVACAFSPMKATVNSILNNPSLAAEMSDDLRAQLEILQMQIAQANRSISELIKND